MSTLQPIALYAQRVLDIVPAAFKAAPYATTVAFSAGAYFLTRPALDFLRMVLQLTVQRGTNLKKYGAGTGAWAVVTGASDGIGREFALQLAAKGFNIALVSRTQSKLDAVSKEISELPGVKVSTLQHTIDFAKAGDAEWTALAAALAPLDVGILVNNAGITHPGTMGGNFVDDGPALSADIVTVNATTTVRITSLLLPRMVARKRGLVLSTGSLAGGLGPIPSQATYGATKAFLTTWTQALGVELAKSKSGVDALVVIPGVIAPGMLGTQAFTPSWWLPDTTRFVRATLSSLGLQGGSIGRRFVANPFWSHALMEFVVRTFGLEDLLGDSVYDEMVKVNAQAAKTK